MIQDITHWLYTLTQGPLPTGIHLLSHLQGLCGGYVHISWNNHQANGLLFLDERVNEVLNLKLSKVQQICTVTKSLLSLRSSILTLNVIVFYHRTNWST